MSNIANSTTNFGYALLFGALLGILQGMHNANSESFNTILEGETPIIIYIFFGVAGVVGIFLKPPKRHELLNAFASSLIVFSGGTSLILYFQNNLSDLLGAMSAGAVGLGSGMFIYYFRRVFFNNKTNET